MYAHSAGCASGDSTLDALKHAVAEVRAPYAMASKALSAAVTARDDASGGVLKASTDADDYIVILLSDANLGRYGIRPEEVAQGLTADANVHAVAVFLAEPTAAHWITQHVPPGLAASCLEANELPATIAKLVEASASR
jgi:hypothetical protein